MICLSELIERAPAVAVALLATVLVVLWMLCLALLAALSRLFDFLRCIRLTVMERRRGEDRWTGAGRMPLLW